MAVMKHPPGQFFRAVLFLVVVDYRPTKDGAVDFGSSGRVFGGLMVNIKMSSVIPGVVQVTYFSYFY
jgi:hypothetical protein